MYCRLPERAVGYGTNSPIAPIGAAVKSPKRRIREALSRNTPERRGALLLKKKEISIKLIVL
jgi:hypothetical protein